MKIDPKHDYRKPLYAAGVAALVGATAMFGTACGPNGPRTAGETTTTESDIELAGDTTTCETSDVELDGEVAIETDEVELAGEEIIETDYVELDGDVAVCDPTDETFAESKVEKNGN